MCDNVLEDISCPARNMRCCVEKSSAAKPKPPPRENVNPLDSFLELELPPKPEDKSDKEEETDAVEDDEEEEPVTEKEEKKVKKRRKKDKRKTTTTEATTTTTESTTTKVRF